MKIKNLIRICGIIAMASLFCVAAVFFCACKEKKQEDLKSISVLNGFKTEYYIGEELDPTGTLKVFYQTDYFGVVQIKEDMISGFDSSKEGDCVITVSYGGKSTTVLLRILPLKATAIELDAATMPEVVYKGDSFPSGVTLHAVMENGDTREGIAVTSDMLGGFDSRKLGEQLVTLRYAGLSATFTLTVKEDPITAIALVGEKSVYSVGEELFSEGVLLKVIYESGKYVSRPLDLDSVSDFSTARGGNYAALITYTDAKSGETYTCRYYYSVGIVPVSGELLEGTLPAEIEKGAEFPKGGLMRITFDDATTADIPITLSDVTGFDSSSAGEFSAEIEVRKQKAHYSYKVLRAIERATVLGFTKAVPMNAEFDGFGVIALTYEDGVTENLSLKDPSVTLDYDTSTSGDIAQTASFRGRKFDFTVTVFSPEERNAVESISLIGAFRAIVQGGSPDPSGMMVYVNYKFLEPATTRLEPSMISFDAAEEISGDFESRKVTISLLGETIETSVTVLSPEYAARVTSIVAYNLQNVVVVGEELDLSSGGLIATYGGGYAMRSGIPLSEAEIEGFDSSAVGETTITISFGGASCEAKIRVISEEEKETPTDARVAGFSPIVFEGDSLSSLDISGASVTLTLGYGFGERTIPLEYYMLSGGPFNEAGQAQIIFTYKGIEKRLTITVHSADEKAMLTAISVSEIKTTVGVYPDLSKVPLKLEYGFGRRTVFIPLSSAGVGISPFSVDKVGVERAEVSYQGKTAPVIISFAASGSASVVERIEIDAESKLSFEKGSALTGVMIQVYYASGGSSRLNVTEDMAPGFKTDEAGNHTVTVAYGGKSAVLSYAVTES